MKDGKKEMLLSMDMNEQIYCDYCGGDCTVSSLIYGNQYLTDEQSILWQVWDLICLDCAEKLDKRLEEDEELVQFMQTTNLIRYGFEHKSDSQ